jgi:hypothetical protein
MVWHWQQQKHKDMNILEVGSKVKIQEGKQWLSISPSSIADRHTTDSSSHAT